MQTPKMARYRAYCTMRGSQPNDRPVIVETPDDLIKLGINPIPFADLVYSICTRLGAQQPVYTCTSLPRTRLTVDSNTYALSPDEPKISALSLKVCGLQARLQTQEFDNLITQHDILCFQETKLNKESIDHDAFSKLGYSTHVKNRYTVTNRKSGGLMMC